MADDPRNELGAIVARIYDYPHGCPGEHGNSQQITYLFHALERSSWLAANDAEARADQRQKDAQIAERTVESMSPLGARTKAAIAAAILAAGFEGDNTKGTNA